VFPHTYKTLLSKLAKGNKKEKGINQVKKKKFDE
jgi:hypothetical protein